MAAVLTPPMKHSILPIFAILPILLATPAPATPAWKPNDIHSIELSDEHQVIVRFELNPAPRDPHFSILATPDGRNTLWVAPPDHVWHSGMWFSWKYINGVNFWETNPKTGKQQGLNRIEDAAIESQPDGTTAVIRYRELAHPDPDGPAVLEDSVEIHIERPNESRGPQVTWRITTMALADCTLDRTPIAGEPNGRDWGGYAGFSWRGAKGFQDVRFTDSHGRREMDIHGQRAHWVNAAGSLHGKPAGILIIDHPANPGHSSPWYITNQPKHPFWFVNPALLLPKAIILKKGESFQHTYRAIIHDGSWHEAEISAAIGKFHRHQ